MKVEPRNDQAASLKQMIDEKVSTGMFFCLTTKGVGESGLTFDFHLFVEGVIGLAIVSGVVAVGAALVAAVVKRSK